MDDYEAEPCARCGYGIAFMEPAETFREKATEKANGAVEELDQLAERTRAIQHGETDDE